MFLAPAGIWIVSVGASSDKGTPSTILGKIAKLTNCKKLVLTHLVPTKFNENKLKNTIKKDYGKNPIIGKDLLKIRI